MTKSNDWQLQPGIQMSAETAGEVAKIACALKSLSAYATLMLEQEDDSDELQQMVQSGMEAMNRIFKV
ncbi:MAG: hypothetical protein KJ787_15310 [Gammaproteobacteria bacterium]|nr:hypothetical protein [Gammaproteobacteria bacterium]MBU1647699.1 hypothetical protein [Gammaproteobacteria bacterium]MBU1971845.1 hypothetical protein [Gammaproteobacteria bacterium]